jgi:molybdopterin synthase sulfur carrier subunit
MRVKVFATYRPLVGAADFELAAPANISELLQVVAGRYPGLGAKILGPDGAPSFDVIIMVNGRHIQHLQGISTPLVENDTVQLFPLVAGG